MMESKTKPKKKGFNLFDDDDDDDIEEVAAPSFKNSVSEGPKTTSPNNNILIGSGNMTPTTPRFGYQAQQQAAATVPANNNTMNPSVAAASKPVTTSTADQSVRSFGSRPTTTAAAYARKAMTTSNLDQQVQQPVHTSATNHIRTPIAPSTYGQPIRGYLPPHSASKNTTSSNFGQQAQRTSVPTTPANPDRKPNADKAPTTSYNEEVQAFLDLKAASRQPVQTTTTHNTVNTSAAAAAPSKPVTKSDHLMNTFRSCPKMVNDNSANKYTTTTSNLGQPTSTFGSRATTVNDSANKNTLSSNQQVQHTTLRGNIPGDKIYNEQVQAFLDSRAASKQRTIIPCVNNASESTAVEQLRPVIKNINVTPVVAETRPTGIPKVSTSVQTAANEEQVQPVDAPMVIQQPKAAAASEPRPALSKLQPVTMATVEQQTETPSAAAVPSDKLGIALMALPNKDFVFKVKYDQVPIHKTVLGARSYYFYQQFYESSGSDSPTFENADDFDKEVIELAVRACYGQSFDETILNERVAEQLIKFADTYGMSCVKNLLQQTLANCLTEETVCAAAIRSYDTNDFKLRQKCAAFVAALILQNKSTPRGIEELPADFNKEIVLSIIAEKNKKQ